MSVFADAHGYLNSSIRTYVNATKTLDKLFAIKLLVLSMIVSADKLIESLGKGADTPFTGQVEESSFFLPMAAYEQRLVELCDLEENNIVSAELQLSLRLRKALDILKIVYERYGLRQLLAVNIKDVINDSFFFILDIQQLVEDFITNQN